MRTHYFICCNNTNKNAIITEGKFSSMSRKNYTTITQADHKTCHRKVTNEGIWKRYCKSWLWLTQDATNMDAMKNMNDDVIKWKHFPRYWPFVRGIHRSPVNSPHKGQWRGTLMFSLICTWTNSWANNGDVGDLKRHRAHYDVIVMDASRMKHRNKTWGHQHIPVCNNS